MSAGRNDISADELIAIVIKRHESEILDEYEKLLAESCAEVPTKSSFYQLRQQAAAVLNDVHDRLLVPAHLRPQSDGLSAAIGVACAEQESHPTESLRAAGVMYQAILTGITNRVPKSGGVVPGLLRLAITLHRATMDRLAASAVGYLGYLLERLHESHSDERRRVARELHDVVANSVAVALQNLELYALHHENDPGRSATKLDNALAALRDSLDGVREVAQDLRRSGAEDGIQPALNAYLDDAPAGGAAVDVRFDGDEGPVPPAIRGELFLILREAVRNARAHARARRIEVAVNISPQLVRAQVTDDGRGFHETGQARGTGLASMRERVALLGGVIGVSSTLTKGTVVDVRVPLRMR